MARGPRITYPHAIFHVLNRFVDKHPFFSKDRDYHDFLDAYFDTAKTFGIWTYAYDLVPNHFHIVLETPTGEISRFLQRFLTTAVQKLNAVHGRTGHLLQGRTKTLVVEKDRYFETVVGYVLLNRVRAGLARTVLSDPYNSAREMITRGKTRIARGPLWSYLFGHEFNSRRIDHEITLCRQWLNSLDADHNADEFEAGHHGSFLSSAQYRSTTLEHLERRQLEMGTKTRRKTDRHKKEWTWDEIIKACDNVLKKGQWRKHIGRTKL